MSASLTLTQDQIMTALRGFLLSVLPPGTEVIRGLGNGVPMPLGGFVAMTHIAQVRLATNHDTGTWDDPARLQPVEQLIQIDCYGPDSSGWAALLSTLLRDRVGCDAFPAGMAPLYCDDPRQMVLEDAEQNYTERWMVQLHLQTNIGVTL